MSYSLDAEVCLWSMLLFTVLMQQPILNVYKAKMRYIVISTMLLNPFLFVAFDLPIGHAMMGTGLFVVTTFLASMLFEYVVRDSVPRVFWPYAFVVDVGLLNGILMWKLINL